MAMARTTVHDNYSYSLPERAYDNSVPIISFQKKKQAISNTNFRPPLPAYPLYNASFSRETSHFDF